MKAIGTLVGASGIIAINGFPFPPKNNCAAGSVGVCDAPLTSNAISNAGGQTYMELYNMGKNVQATDESIYVRLTATIEYEIA